MSILAKVNQAPYICKVYLDFNGSLTPVNDSDSQNFYNSLGNQYTWKPVHFGLKSVSFSETEKETSAGTEYTQKLKIQFPNADSQRTDRIEKIKSAKFVRIELSNGISLVMGRNDFFQNKPLTFTTSSSENLTSVTVATTSIFSVGILQIIDVSQFVEFLMPSLVPKTLINT